MIVKCASCQTRFKIGDDKVTEKGVKVRCTKCGTVFVVRKGDDATAAAAPAPSARSKAPVAPSSVGSLDDLFSMPVVPVAAAGTAAPAAPSDDPFAGFLAGPAPPPKNELLPGEFALSAVDAPAPVVTPPPGATPIADLLGLDSTWPAAGQPGPPKSPSSKAPRSPGSKPPKTPVSKPPKRPPPDAPDPFDAALDPLGGSSAPSTPPPPDPFAQFASEALDANQADAGQAEATFDPLAGLSLSGSDMPAPAEPNANGLDISDELFARPPSPARASVPQPAIESNLALASETTVERQRGRGVVADLDAGDDPAEKPLSVRIFNAVAGVSLVTLLLLGFVIYRNGGRVDLHDPLAAFFSAFGFSRPSASHQNLTARISESGLYSNLRGDPILFVRGSVENLSGNPQQVELKLEVSFQGQVVATASGIPGFSPTPEDLFTAKNAAEVKALLDRVSSGTAPPIPSGGRSDFLLVVPDVPASILTSSESTELKVTAHPVAEALNQPQPSAKD